MSMISGLVEDVKIKNGSGVNGLWTMLDVTVKGERFSGFINNKTKDDRASVKQGDTVEIQWKQNGKYKNLESLKIKPVEQAVATPAPAGIMPAQQTTTLGYVPADVREFRITVASARNSAIAFVDLAIKNEALPLSKTANKKADSILEHVNYYTELFAKQLLAAKLEEYTASEEAAEEVEEEMSE